MQRPLQRTDAADDGGVDIGEGGGDDARRKRGRVQLVVGVQDERDIEGTRREAVRPLAGQHVEEVRGVAQHRVRRNRSAARVHPPHSGDQRAELRGEANGLAVVGCGRVVAGIRVVVREDRRQRAQGIHALATLQFNEFKLGCIARLWIRNDLVDQVCDWPNYASEE